MSEHTIQEANFLRALSEYIDYIKSIMSERDKKFKYEIYGNYIDHLTSIHEDLSCHSFSK